MVAYNIMSNKAMAASLTQLNSDVKQTLNKKAQSEWRLNGFVSFSM